MQEPALLETRTEAVVHLVLNRPKSRNALDSALVEALALALTRAEEDAATRVIVLSGAGGAFCSGLDLKTAAPDIGDRERAAGRLEGFHRVIRGIVNATKPVIAAVDGPAVGFGADLAFACDLRLASTNAYFDCKFVALGLMPDGGGTFHLPRLIGLGRALEHLLLGTRIDAALAERYGLVSAVHSPNSVVHEALELADRLAAGPPLALRAIKSAVRASYEGTFEAALAREFSGQLALLESEDLKEGLRAFAERRPPVFRGR